MRALDVSRLAAGLAVALLVGACGDDGPERSAERRVVAHIDDLCGAAAWKGAIPTDESHPAQGVAVTPFAEFSEPVDLAVRPGDDSSLFLLEKAGEVYAVGADGAARELVGDIRPMVSETSRWQPRGALGLEFARDGRFAYVYYVDHDGRTVVSEFPVGDDGIFDIAAERRLLTLDQHEDAWHYGGDLAFGPDGMLYIALGDGDSGIAEHGGDPDRRAHDPRSWYGSILRIDPAASGSSPYTVPPDNPFAGEAVGAPEVWAWGLRNPWRFAFDRLTGDLWIADVGFFTSEEVSYVPRGDAVAPARCANFGWSRFEGDTVLHTEVRGPGHLVEPIVTYGRDTGCAVTGGVAYRGGLVEGLAGAFVYSDVCGRALWAVDPRTRRVDVLATGLTSINAVREGPGGEIYLLDSMGVVYRVVPR